VQQSRVTESHANTSCVDNLSEVMNTGYSEGDGGIMYLHASLVKGYGMHIRENFLHHSLDVPGLIGRHAIQFDDHFGAVSNCSGNVLYKAAGIGIATSGAGNNVTNNLIVNSGMAIAVSALDDMTINLKKYDNGTLKRGDKMDYIWNAESALGVAGSYPALFKTALAARFPTFARLLSVNSTHEGWASAGSQTFIGNFFLNNSQVLMLLLLLLLLLLTTHVVARGTSASKMPSAAVAKMGCTPGTARLARAQRGPMQDPLPR
jgi:hypothetical protein